MSIDIDKVNEELRGKDPLDIVRWAVEYSDEIICSTNFRPHEAVILHMATQVKADMPILWADGGYALKETYVFAQKVIDQLNLNMKVFNPLMTTARREAVKGTVPSIEDKEAHDDFTWDTKIEPFRRGLDELKPKKIQAFESKLENALRNKSLHNEAEVMRLCIESEMTCQHAASTLLKLRKEGNIDCSFNVPDVKKWKSPRPILYP